ncbi:Clan ME, family M16, insulinase-like metallopeptidase [Tritrichomonas foetus]|uniref:Clan ME, family M16, insulinase-like metallopeptidase n=1 Tax=Tritrichomonas foetus TaxID=1144522 RepID=A0A1J4IZA7_9EUKA|nr:Clan ME, family M16, insulinase-like metallopeptidase [Tritrichomonas foetus]|eukprot:OHS92750.1 Clan ME, family M16, insulinase-like metallopeptidase [Tritrichomonas foetus]
MSGYPQDCGNFHLTRTQEFPEYQATCLIYEHKIHKCPFWIIYAPSDDHNCYSITIRTLPFDNSGVNHMLEHMTLQGSEKYPIPDLFNEMLKISYATFMNARTSTEWSMYPFSTTNEFDYHNNLDVYLDAVFHPKLDDKAFNLECHHLEFEDDDIEKPLKRVGVVYNEMCGSINSPAAFLQRKVMEHLYPDCVSKFTFGGLPEDIAKMTINDVRKAHDKFYNPSNALFYHYGNFNISKILEKVDNCISQIEPSDYKFDPSVCITKDWEEPKKITIDIPMGKGGQEEESINATLAWVCDQLYHEDLMTDFEFLSDLLFSQTSPMYKALIKSHIATRFSLTGFNQVVLCPPMFLSVEGISRENAEKFDEIVLNVLQEIYEKGFDDEYVNTIFESWEDSIHSPSANMGQRLIDASVSSWIHGIDPFDMINSKRAMNLIHKKYNENHRYFEELIKKYLIDNKHRLHIIGIPVDGLNDKFNEEIAENLKQIKDKMTENEKIELNHKVLQLREHLQTPKPIELLPRFNRKYISEDKIFTQPNEIRENISVFIQPVCDNTYMYLRLKLNTNHTYIKYLDLMVDLITELGAGGLNEDEFHLYTNKNLRVFTCQCHATTDYMNPEKWYAEVVLIGNCVDKKLDKLLEVLQMIYNGPNFDNLEAMETILKMICSSLKKRATQSIGIVYSLLEAGYSPCRALVDMWSGSYVINLLEDIISNNKYEEFSQICKQLFNEVFLKGEMHGIFYVTTQEQKEKVFDTFTPFIKKYSQVYIEQPPHESIIEHMNNCQKLQKIYAQSDVNAGFSVMSLTAPPYNSEKSPICAYLDEILEKEFLYDIIRVKLGSYGVFTRYSPSGYFQFISIRDRNPVACLEAFRMTLNEVAEGNITQDQVENAVIRIMSGLDQPQNPQSKGLAEHSMKIPLEMLKKRRRIFLNATREQIIEVAKELRDLPYKCGILSSPKIAPPPEEYTIIDLMK